MKFTRGRRQSWRRGGGIILTPIAFSSFSSFSELVDCIDIVLLLIELFCHVWSSSAEFTATVATICRNVYAPQAAHSLQQGHYVLKLSRCAGVRPDVCLSRFNIGSPCWPYASHDGRRPAHRLYGRPHSCVSMDLFAGR